jgi:hypothetical protein
VTHAALREMSPAVKHGLAWNHVIATLQELLGEGPLDVIEAELESRFCQVREAVAFHRAMNE